MEVGGDARGLVVAPVGDVSTRASDVSTRASDVSTDDDSDEISNEEKIAIDFMRDADSRRVKEILADYEKKFPGGVRCGPSWEGPP